MVLVLLVKLIMCALLYCCELLIKWCSCGKWRCGSGAAGEKSRMVSRWLVGRFEWWIESNWWSSFGSNQSPQASLSSININGFFQPFLWNSPWWYVTVDDLTARNNFNNYYCYYGWLLGIGAKNPWTKKSTKNHFYVIEFFLATLGIITPHQCLSYLIYFRFPHNNSKQLPINKRFPPSVYFNSHCPGW